MASSQRLTLADIFQHEEDLIGRIASFCDWNTLQSLSRTSKACRKHSLPYFTQARKNWLFSPRESGQAKVHWFGLTHELPDGEGTEDIVPDWVGEFHGPGKWIEVDQLERTPPDLHAFDLVIIEDVYGLSPYFVAVREDRLVLIRAGGPSAGILPPDAFAAAKTWEKYGSYFVKPSKSYIGYAELPKHSRLFVEHHASQPSPEHRLILRLDFVAFHVDLRPLAKPLPEAADMENMSSLPILFWIKPECAYLNW